MSSQAFRSWFGSAEGVDCQMTSVLTQGAAQPMLSAMVSTLVTVFEAHRTASCLTTLAVAIEFFGDNLDAAPLLAAVLTSVCGSAAPIYKVVPLWGTYVMFAIQQSLCVLCITVVIAILPASSSKRAALPAETLVQYHHDAAVPAPS